MKVSAYLEQLADIPHPRIAYVDETGIDSYLYREYAYSERGKPVYGVVSGVNIKKSYTAKILEKSRFVRCFVFLCK